MSVIVTEKNDHWEIMTYHDARINRRFYNVSKKDFSISNERSKEYYKEKKKKMV